MLKKKTRHHDQRVIFTTLHWTGNQSGKIEKREFVWIRLNFDQKQFSLFLRKVENNVDKVFKPHVFLSLFWEAPGIQRFG